MQSERKPITSEDDQQTLFDKGTGTHGPAPVLMRRPAVAPRRAVAVKTPYGDVLRHIIHTVKATLKAENVQLGDGPTQDLISTVFIAACKHGQVEYDFTRGAE